MRDPRAIIFDLDDTLYPLEWFVQSGFVAAAAWLEAEHGIDAHTALSLMRRARAYGERGREFQVLCARFTLPVSTVPALVRVVREHEPRIHMPEESTAVLGELHRSWRIGVLTNGLPDVQRRKIRALKLVANVDCIVFASDVGTGLGKPDPAAFQAVLSRLDVQADRAVVVGDDPIADIHGAGLLGIRTVHLSRARIKWPEGVMPPDACVSSILEVPQAADRLAPAQELARVA
jgi:putative hydrolase of the HAD superfamily